MLRPKLQLRPRRGRRRPLCAKSSCRWSSRDRRRLHPGLRAHSRRLPRTRPPERRKDLQDRLPERRAIQGGAGQLAVRSRQRGNPDELVKIVLPFYVRAQTRGRRTSDGRSGPRTPWPSWSPPPPTSDRSIKASSPTSLRYRHQCCRSRLPLSRSATSSTARAAIAAQGRRTLPTRRRRAPATKWCKSSGTRVFSCRRPRRPARLRQLRAAMAGRAVRSGPQILGSCRWGSTSSR